ncbi:hypothetical protein [Kocuria sp.]|uniref:hypothetical protein n=1 Tax=Kocuria sp. TaxID=1871328 RepID=UPI0026E05AD5|nr:hypothetical protein [Kocuria sp.]MDO5619274.1 hypothetical protein [Kocuria sp.]
MTLLSSPRHAVLVQLYGLRSDDEGVEEVHALGEPVEVRCNVHPLSTDEREALGVLTTETYRITARDWPGDHRTRVFYDGRWWDQVGEPSRFRMSSRTQHDSVLISAREPRKVVPHGGTRP